MLVLKVNNNEFPSNFRPLVLFGQELFDFFLPKRPNSKEHLDSFHKAICDCPLFSILEKKKSFRKKRKIAHVLPCLSSKTTCDGQEEVPVTLNQVYRQLRQASRYTHVNYM